MLLVSYCTRNGGMRKGWGEDEGKMSWRLKWGMDVEADGVLAKSKTVLIFRESAVRLNVFCGGFAAAWMFRDFEQHYLGYIIKFALKKKLWSLVTFNRLFGLMQQSKLNLTSWFTSSTPICEVYNDLKFIPFFCLDFYFAFSPLLYQVCTPHTCSIPWLSPRPPSCYFSIHFTGLPVF